MLWWCGLSALAQDIIHVQVFVFSDIGFSDYVQFYALDL
jgi:hypothetical protein